ncbi:MAG TPA: hypothetical protein VNZ56_02480 [Verrucomicrobiae bacterium]|jgi:hypothetical protein|nr:hypothetical protein [Verrucomicrobiae bacterium]
MRFVLFSIALIFLPTGMLLGQSEQQPSPNAASGAPHTVELEVPAGTPLPVVLADEVRIRKPGQVIHGKIAEPVYAFDQLVVPAGSEVSGSVTRIAGISAWQRTLAALDANFSPTRDVEITFDQLTLPDGHRVPLHTQVSPASQGVLQLATAADPDDANKGKKNAAAKLASDKVSEKKQEIGREWHAAVEQVKTPGKMHRLKRIFLAEMPVHPQYFDAGTRFNAELLDPLNFGTEEVTSEKIQMVGTAPTAGSVIHALLETPLSSASAQRGEEVSAIMTEPLITNSQLILPEGTILKGSVLQVQAARRLHRNGQLRIVFHQVVPPQAAEQQVEASLEGVEVKDDQNLSLDSEGGAQATTPKTRYLTTGISIALAVTTALPDPDAGASGQSVGELGGRAATGASGFRAIGFALGALVKSRPLAAGMGAYGAGMSVYANFLSRGHDVVYPKDTAMAIGFGSRVTGPQKSSPQT